MKKFIIIGNMNAVTCKEIFTYIMNNEMWLGTVYNKTMLFQIPDSYEKFSVIENGVKYGKVPAISWFTNIEHNKRNTPIDLYKRYSNEYPRYENYDAIEVAKVADIPMDYDGVMAVPISFLNTYCPEQFEIVSSTNDVEKLKELGVQPLGKHTIEIMHKCGNFSHLTAKMVQLYYFENGKFKRPFSRLLIRKRTEKSGTNQSRL